MKSCLGAYTCTGVFFMNLKNRKGAGRMTARKKSAFKKLLICICAAAFVLAGIEVASFFYFISQEPAKETAVLPGEEGIVIRSGNAESDQMALTCNVDWGEDVLPDMLKTFREKDISVTFFVTGQWAEKHPDLVRQMYLEGHSVQSHGYSHKLCSQVDKETIRQEMEKTEKAIQKILGYKPTVFAPPSGDYNEAALELCKEKGYVLSLWSSDTIDWKPGSTADVIRSRILGKPLSGAIVLMHPKEETAKALPGLIDEIRKRGIEIVPLNDFICSELKKEV